MEAVKEEAIETPEDMLKAEKEANEKLRELAYKMLDAGTRQAVEEAKGRGIQPYTVNINDVFYVYRIMNRMEYHKHTLESVQQAEKLISDAKNPSEGRVLAELRSQEDLFLKCLIYPHVDKITIKELPAGVIDTVSDEIMRTSGFGQNPIAIKL